MASYASLYPTLVMRYTTSVFGNIEYVKVVNNCLIFKVHELPENIIVRYCKTITNNNTTCNYCDSAGRFYVKQHSKIYNLDITIPVCNACHTKIERLWDSQLPENKFVVGVMNINCYVNCEYATLLQYEALQRYIYDRYVPNLIVIYDMIADVKNVITIIFAKLVVNNHQLLH